MKRYFSLLIVVILLFAFYGCQEITEATTGEIVYFDQTQAKETKLRVWLDDTNGVYMNKIIPDFEAKNPGIKIEFQHKATVDARAALKTYGQSGYGADVFQFPHDHMAQAILDDLVYVLPNDLKDRLTERVLPVAMDIATVNYNDETKSFDPSSPERLFAVPMSIESITIYYNRALISDEEAQSITTFEQLIAKSQAYYNAAETQGKRFFATTSHWGDAYYLQPFYSAFGWQPFGPNLNDPTAVGFADQKAIDTITWLVNTLKPEVTGNANHNSVAGATEFQNGNVPMVLAGPWNYNTFRDANVDFGAITIPTINGNPTKTFAGAQMVSVYKYSKNPDAALKFVEYLASDDAAKILYEQTGKCPALNENILATIPGIKDDAIINVMLEQLKTSVPMPTIPEVTYYWGPAESMMRNVWNSGNPIADEVVGAENSYKAARDLAK